VTNALLVQLAQAWSTTSWTEILAVVLAFAYLLLAIRQSLSCWIAAFVSSCLYVWVFFAARLYMDSALNVFYAVMAVYGFWQWHMVDKDGAHHVRRWSLSRNALAAAGILGMSAVNGYFLSRYTLDPFPFLDSVVSWGSVFATFLVARKVYENWHWWLIIDAASACLYFAKGLYLTVLLFALYLALIVIGMREWRRSLPLAPAHVS
jgi:nicotinamide mononucleotide transporter